MAQNQTARPADDQLYESPVDAVDSPRSPANSPSDAQRTPETYRTSVSSFTSSQSQGPIITDADRARWLAAKLTNCAALQEFAAQRISDTEVKRFAEDSARQVQQQATLLEQAAAQRSQDAWEQAREQSQDAPALSETLEDIGQAVQNRVEQRAGQSDGGRLLERDEQGQNAEVDPRRQRTRERLGVLLPAVRQELPELLELLGEAIEDEGSGPAAWVGHQNRVAERMMEAKKKELSRYEGAQLVQAYLGMDLVAAIELGAASEVVAENTDQSLHELLAGTTELVQQHAERCRQLMEQQYQANDTAAAESNDRPARRQAVAPNSVERQ